MATDILNLDVTALNSITDLGQLGFGSDNQLQKRSDFSALVCRMKDAFLGLSRTGRASIAARNSRIMEAMRVAVQENRGNAEAPDLSQSLENLVTRLQTAAQNSIRSALNEAGAEIENGPDFARLPESSRRVLSRALENTIAGAATTGAITFDRARDRMESLKKAFCGIIPESHDPAKGIRDFARELKKEFLKPVQQALVDEKGFHQSFDKDCRRGDIAFIGHTDTPANMSAEFYREALKNTLPEQYHPFLPFISMMASQAGLGSARLFLPVLSGLSEQGNEQLLDAGLLPLRDFTEHKLNITRSGTNLVMMDNFFEGFAHEPGTPWELGIRGEVTMIVNLAVPPERVRVGDREVLIPQFHLEAGNALFEIPENRA